jgi:hypothetical protein
MIVLGAGNLRPVQLPDWDIVATRACPTRNGSPSIDPRGLGKKQM